MSNGPTNDGPINDGPLISPIDRLSRKSARLILRALRPDDRDAWIRAHVASAEEFTRWMPQSDPTIPMERRFQLQLARAIDGARMETSYSFVAQHRIDGELVAFCSLSQVFRGPFQNAYAGWRVSTPYCGQGIGTEAVGLLLDAAFDEPPHGIGLHRVQANVIPTNLASLKVAKKNGFREEGYAKRYLEINGRYQDHVMFAKLADEHGLA